LYKEFVESELAIPVVSGIKSEREKFAGALATYAIEALMSDGKALQMGTSHNLGQHFSKVFNIRYEDKNQNIQYVWQTSWGVSTRLVGALIMAHGDDSGLRLPPRIAPIQAVIVPISLGNWKEEVLPIAEKLKSDLIEMGVRVELDQREEFTPGWKFSEWEMRGVPLRIEIGPRDVKENQVVCVRRDSGNKETVPLDSLRIRLPEILSDIQKSLYEKALEFQTSNTHDIQSYEEFKSILEDKKGFLRTYWCGRSECEEKIKEETMATIRVILLEKDESKADGECILCGKKSNEVAYFARAY
jgi:prolyl-tRNA synthetase